jgi:hypothetical protein
MISDSDEDDGADEETANPSQPNKTNKTTADQVGEPQTKDQKKEEPSQEETEPKEEENGSAEKEDRNTNWFLSQGPTIPRDHGIQ